MVRKEAYIRSTAWANVWIPGCDYCQTILKAILGMWVGVWPHTITLPQSIKRSEWTKTNLKWIWHQMYFVCLFVFAAGSDLPWSVCAAACSADVVWKIWEWTSYSSYLIGIVFAVFLLFRRHTLIFLALVVMNASYSLSQSNHTQGLFFNPVKNGAVARGRLINNPV